MLLAIDIGNSHIVLGCKVKNDWVKTWRISTSPMKTPDEIKILLQSLLNETGTRFSDIQAVVASSVVPSWNNVLTETFSNSYFHLITHTSPFLHFEISDSFLKPVFDLLSFSF
jgi:type III pantothenate kinase